MVIGIIGGSGLYQMGSTPSEEIKVETPYGEPSDIYRKIDVGDNTLIFISRHGQGHRISPSEINYRANIYGLKKLGATTVLSISAVGSLREDIAPGDFVLPDQYIDLTKGIRKHSFFGEGVVAHAHFADPCCRTNREHVEGLLKSMKVKCHTGGTYICMEGPQFSTRAESHLYRSWNIPKSPVSVIGMTAMPEARLAREAGLCYQTVAMSTDYDCWNEKTGDVNVQEILAVLQKNVSTSQQLIQLLAENSFPSCRSACRELMKFAVVTDRLKFSSAKTKELEVILN